MCVHFILSGLARVYNIYCIYVYSVIDPSWDLSFRFRYLLVTWCFDVLIVFVTGMWERRLFERLPPFFCFIPVYSLSLTLDPVLVLLLSFAWLFRLGFILHFSGFLLYFGGWLVGYEIELNYLLIVLLSGFRLFWLSLQVCRLWISCVILFLV